MKIIQSGIYLLCGILLCVGRVGRAADDASSTPGAAADPTAVYDCPGALALGYEVNTDCVSPNGKYAVMHGRRESADAGTITDPKIYLVTLAPFKKVAVMPGGAYVPGYNHASLDVEWAKDSAAVLVNLGAKWGPASVYVVELAKGRVVRKTDVLAGVEKLMGAYFAKSDPGKYKESGGGFTVLDSTTWTFVPDGVQVTCDATNDLKQMGGGWGGELAALWNMKERKWVDVKPVPSYNYYGQ